MRYRPWTSPSPASALQNGFELRARQASTNTCLPQSLLSVVPNCAVTCIQSFASHDYPGATCADTTDLNYLCTQPNTSGLTIGEGSVQCVVSFCTGQDQVDVNVYNICTDIDGAQPRTIRTITATIATSASTASTMTTLPATIGDPTSTKNLSTIVMATDSPTWIIATPSATTTSAAGPSTTDNPSSTSMSTSTNMSAGPGATSGVNAMSDQATSRSGLTTPQIAGIAIGGAATALVILGLLLLLCWMRKRRRNRRRSQRRSRLIEQTPPPNYQSPQKKTSPTFDTIASSLASPSTNGRFYAPPTMEEKRRSFWRKSIRPEEIGVAVSPKLPGGHSPVSASSQQSFSLLLPIAPAAALWPAPLDVQATRVQKRYSQRPNSEATEFDDEPNVRTQEAEQIVVDNQPFILEKPPLAKRPRGPPPNLKLPMVPENPPRSATKARIPLTPTYDNGNVDFTSPPRSFRSPTGSQEPLPVAEYRPPASSMYAKRNISGKKPPPRLPLRMSSIQPVEPLMQPRNAPLPPQAPFSVKATSAAHRQSSASSVYTEIEEDTTPEEIYKQLGLRANPPTPSTFPSEVRNITSGQGSPIKDLRYPLVPRSAAISKQAERPPQLRASLGPTPGKVMASAGRPTRDELVRAEASFMQTDTTSSDGYLSDETFAFPAPPSVRTRTSTVAQLRTNPSSGNKRPLPPRTPSSLNEVLSPDTKMVNVAVPQRSPSTKARLTPSKSSTGDLYLTVEI